MKLTVNTGLLFKALDDVQGIVDKKGVVPILSYVCLSAKESQLVINATDMDLEITETLPAEIVEEGAVTVKATLLFDTLKKATHLDNVELILVSNVLQVSFVGFKGELKCLPVEDFPKIRFDQPNTSFTIPSSDFKMLLNKTKSVISLDEMRYYLNGVYVHTMLKENGDKLLRMISTDGHRLALAEIVSDKLIDIEQGVIIPKKSVDELVKLIENQDDQNIGIHLSNNSISFDFESVTFTSRLVDGNFPNYTQVVPTTNDQVVVIDKIEIIKALQLIAAYSDQKKRFVKLSIDNKIILLSSFTDDGEAEVTIAAESQLSDVMIGFNYRYLLDILSLIDSEKVHIKFSLSETPVLITNSDKDDVLFVLMPMRE